MGLAKAPSASMVGMQQRINVSTGSMCRTWEWFSPQEGRKTQFLHAWACALCVCVCDKGSVSMSMCALESSVSFVGTIVVELPFEIGLKLLTCFFTAGTGMQKLSP